ncbi:hypothetical protein MSAN_02461800 [Mycena sanguinolenta]|uniref:Copper transporter n=1 Tax=Mycena sanguinolenta TaxID=230812 RepID=A0A8H6WWV7_9AGAR|nr:hypothetical protein MSAN_02461800 [Mycena sanguinolenta]
MSAITPAEYSGIRHPPLLDYAGGFVLGALFTTAICLLERLLTFIFESRWAPASVRRLRTANALWRAGLYWVLALLRLAYMLIAMSLNASLILIAVTTLAVGQFFIELRTPPSARGGDHEYAPLGDAPTYLASSIDPDSAKPERIFVQQANGAHAGTGAVLLGHKKRGASLGRGTSFQLGGAGTAATRIRIRDFLS